MFTLVYDPTTPTDAERAFETYRFYLVWIQRLLIRDQKKWQTFGDVCLAKTKTLQGMKDVDEAWIRRWLKIAWNTEYLLTVALESTDASLLRISNQWVPIQAYYAIYSASEAAAYAIDGHSADGHAKTLRKMTEHFVKVGLSPWNKAFEGPIGRDGKCHKPVNFPTGLTFPSNLSRHEVDPVAMLGTCLRAEHSNRVREGWHASGRKKFEFDPGFTGLLHFLYRLRVKSNYRDVEIFVNEAPDESVREFAQAVGFVVFRTLLYEEIILVRRCKKKTILALMDEYILLNPAAGRLQKRREFIADRA